MFATNVLSCPRRKGRRHFVSMGRFGLAHGQPSGLRHRDRRRPGATDERPLSTDTPCAPRKWITVVEADAVTLAYELFALRNSWRKLLARSRRQCSTAQESLPGTAPRVTKLFAYSSKSRHPSNARPALDCSIGKKLSE